MGHRTFGPSGGGGDELVVQYEGTRVLLISEQLVIVPKIASTVQDTSKARKSMSARLWDAVFSYKCRMQQ